MGKINENEIVKFIAEVELDPQTAAQYQQNLADTEKHNEALRKSISETVRKMEEMRAQGKQNTEEVKRRFDQAGITIPFPQRTVHLQGTAGTEKSLTQDD